MSQMTYATRRKAETTRVDGQAASAGPSLDHLRGGAVPTSEQLGHKVDLPGAIRAKMEASFGADLSGVELYESQTVADAGAQAVTMGNKIGFAPGRLDFATSGGQALLGHELSHVVSQARGEVAGVGFLNDHALEARADREGAMAAAGQSVYGGPVTPLSASSASVAASPIQAKKPPKISEPTLIDHNSMSRQQALAMFQGEHDAAMEEASALEGEAQFNAQQRAGNRFGRQMAALMEGMSDEELRGDIQFQQAVIGNAGQVANRELLHEERKGGAAPDAAKLNAASLRGKATEGAQRPMSTMMTRMLGGAEGLNHLEDGENAGVSAKRLMDENPEVVGMLQDFRQTAYTGTNSLYKGNEELQSQAIMNNFVNRVLTPPLSTSGDREKLRKAVGIQRELKLTGDGAGLSNDTEGNRSFMHMLASHRTGSAESPKKETLAARRSRLRRQHFRG